MHGQGRLKLIDGTYFDGEYKNNEFKGKHRFYTYQDGSKYSGELINGKRSGEGL